MRDERKGAASWARRPYRGWVAWGVGIRRRGRRRYRVVAGAEEIAGAVGGVGVFEELE
jgi:hypothetical protein